MTRPTKGNPTMRSILFGLALCTTVACGGGKARLEMGGMTAQHVPTVAENAVRMECVLRRGIGRVALRCPALAAEGQRVDLVIWNDGRVQCIARAGYEDECPLVAEALMTPPG